MEEFIELLKKIDKRLESIEGLIRANAPINASIHSHEEGKHAEHIKRELSRWIQPSDRGY